MRNIVFIILILFIYSCDDSFLDRVPKTKITAENFFNTEQDLETYTNSLYEQLSSPYDDIGSDNIGHRDAADDLNSLLQGSLNPANAGSWSWGDLRDINYFFDNLGKVDTSNEKVKHYIGLAKFFRANFYISKVKRFSDVPWYSKTLNVDDKDLLYKVQDKRGVIVDSIISDLQYAVNNLTLSVPKSRVSRAAALACLARFALYEASFRKYAKRNSEETAYLNSQGANDHLSLYKIAIQATDSLMTADAGFSLHENYDELFSSNDLNGNKEIILFNDYLTNERTHNAYTRLDWQYSLSQSLADEYLKIDGSAYTANELKTLSYADMYKNRDPRLAVTIAPPDWKRPGSSTYRTPKLIIGGYGQIKFTPKDDDGWSWDKSYNDLPIYRYAEVLLINAEAHAEIGTLTNAILDNTINLIRKRAGLAPTSYVTTSTPVDPFLDARYANISSASKGALLEIRRERRVELACEGLRADDIFRWHMGDQLLTTLNKSENIPSGLYVPPFTAHESGIECSFITTAAGEDVGVVTKTGADLKTLEEFYKTKKKKDEYDRLGKASLESGIVLTEGSHGHIQLQSKIENPGEFKEPNYYYYPVPESEILVNQNLVQHPFWK